MWRPRLHTCPTGNTRPMPTTRQERLEGQLALLLRKEQKHKTRCSQRHRSFVPLRPNGLRSGLEGSPLTVADWPCDLDKGYPSEDLMVGVMSIDPVNKEKEPTCSTYTSISYFRDWMMNVMNGNVPPSECTAPPETSPALPPEGSKEWCEKCEVSLTHTIRFVRWTGYISLP